MLNNGYKFDSNGDLITTDVYIVWGCPGSGKTTYVKKHMEHGDMIVDLDLIKQSLSMMDKTGAGDNLLQTALTIRELLYDLISRREVNCNNVWVVSGLPDADERNVLAYRLKTDKLIYIEATKQQCIDRAMNDKDRKDKEIQLKIIDKWFNKFYAEE